MKIKQKKKKQNRRRNTPNGCFHILSFIPILSFILHKPYLPSQFTPIRIQAWLITNPIKTQNMYLKKPLWSEGIETEKQDPTGSSDPNASVVELVNSLHQQRVYREVTLALTTGLRDARAEFSFLRLRALRSILNFLNSIVDSDSTIYLFNLTQSIPQLQGRF